MMDKKNDLLKSVIISVIIGAGSTILFLSFYRISNPTFQVSSLQVMWIVLGIVLVSGITSLISAFLIQQLSDHGLNNPFIRLIILSLILIILIGALSYIAYQRFHFKQYESLLIVIGVGGLIIALFVILIDLYVWKIRRKLLELEIENKYLDELANKEQVLVETTNQLIISEERNRIARDLHDSISQGLNGINYMVHAIRHKVKAGDYTHILMNLDDLEETTDETLQELRNMIFALKPEPLNEHGISKALKIQCELFTKRQNVNVETDIDEINLLSTEQELAIYRVVQEALTNVRKHSHATIVKIKLENLVNKVELVIEDNGKGFDLSQPRGNGLNNMHTRTTQNRGNLTIDSRLGVGTLIKVDFWVN